MCRSALAEHQLDHGVHHYGLVCDHHHLHCGAGHQVAAPGQSHCIWCVGAGHGGDTLFYSLYACEQSVIHHPNKPSVDQLVICYKRTSTSHPFKHRVSDVQLFTPASTPSVHCATASAVDETCQQKQQKKVFLGRNPHLRCSNTKLQHELSSWPALCV